MGRYVFKPLLTYLEGDSEQKKLEFLEKYKESLKTGELLVDLYEYDIYISSGGLEYPIPVTSEIREEIIEWIESEEGPLSKYKKDGLINDNKTDFSESTIAKKTEIIEKLMNTIKAYQKAFHGNVDEYENTLLRTERECKYFYRNLANYTLTMVSGYSTSDQKDINKNYDEIVARYFRAYEMYRKINNRVNGKLSKIKGIKENLKQELNEKYKEVVNMGVSLNSKMNKKAILEDDNQTYKTPKYEIKIKVTTKNDNEEFIQPDLSSFLADNSFVYTNENKPTVDIELSENKKEATIKISTK